MKQISEILPYSKRYDPAKFRTPIYSLGFMSAVIDIDDVKTYLLALQDNLCGEIEELDANRRFTEDVWERPQGGGISRVLERGAVFEKAGINFSHVYGARLPASASVNRPEVAGRNFQATGVSAVIHPDNPNVPTSHMNVRFFLAEKPGAAPLWWFGGGFDLTPFDHQLAERMRQWQHAGFSVHNRIRVKVSDAEGRKQPGPAHSNGLRSRPA